MSSKVLKYTAGIFLVLGVWGFLYAAYLITHQDDVQRQSRLAALLGGGGQQVELRPAIKLSDCVRQGPLPDPNCTPGAVFPEAKKEKICVTGYSKTVRNVSQSTKKKVYAMYGVSYPPLFGSYELDHFIALSLGGNNDISNLFPLSAEPFPGFREKDIVVNYLHEEVCRGTIALGIAQKQIATDWTLIYNNLDPKRIAELKLKYPSWADRK